MLLNLNSKELLTQYYLNPRDYSFIGINLERSFDSKILKNFLYCDENNISYVYTDILDMITLILKDISLITYKIVNNSKNLPINDPDFINYFNKEYRYHKQNNIDYLLQLNKSTESKLINLTLIKPTFLKENICSLNLIDLDCFKLDEFTLKNKELLRYILRVDQIAIDYPVTRNISYKNLQNLDKILQKTLKYIYPNTYLHTFKNIDNNFKKLLFTDVYYQIPNKYEETNFKEIGYINYTRSEFRWYKLNFDDFITEKINNIHKENEFDQDVKYFLPYKQKGFLVDILDKILNYNMIFSDYLLRELIDRNLYLKILDKLPKYTKEVLSNFLSNYCSILKVSPESLLIIDILLSTIILDTLPKEIIELVIKSSPALKKGSRFSRINDRYADIVYRNLIEYLYTNKDEILKVIKDTTEYSKIKPKITLEDFTFINKNKCIIDNLLLREKLRLEGLINV